MKCVIDNCEEDVILICLCGKHCFCYKHLPIKICPFCNKDINVKDFTDTLSKKEYLISGLCQKCQDETFKENE